MARVTLEIYLSYSQVCVFLSSLAQPFNDWSDRNVSQGFSWRPGSVSFRALVEDGAHKINVFVGEPVPEMASTVVRAFSVPFEALDGKIEIASISDAALLEVLVGKYALQVEFLRLEEGCMPEINIRLNKSEAGFAILKADDELVVDGDLDLMAEPAI